MAYYTMTTNTKIMPNIPTQPIGPAHRPAHRPSPLAQHTKTGLAKNCLAQHGHAKHGHAQHGLAQHGLAGLAERTRLRQTRHQFFKITAKIDSETKVLILSKNKNNFPILRTASANMLAVKNEGSKLFPDEET